MGARLYGDWNKLRSWIDRMNSGAPIDEMKEQVEATAEATKEIVTGHIRRQDWKRKALSPITVASKGGNRKVYFETGQYLDSIDVIVKDKGEGVTIAVAPIGSHSSGLDMQELAVMLEYGTSKMPARPLWRPSFREVQGTLEWKYLMDLKDKFGF